MLVLNDKRVYKTRRGDVRSTIREHYLRSDIYCQSARCQVCPHDPAAMGTGTELSLTADHYLVPDRTYADFFTDLLESDAIADVILLQTVLGGVTSSKPVERLRKMSKIVAKRCVVIPNEFSREMYAPRQAGESVDHRDARAVLAAAEWYVKHLDVNIIVLSEPESPVFHVYNEVKDDEKRDSTCAAKVSVLSGSDYISGYIRKKDGDEVAASLSRLYESLLPIYREAVTAAMTSSSSSLFAVSPDSKIPGVNVKYSAYVSERELEEGVAKGRYLRGKFSVDQHATTTGYVRLSHPTDTITKVLISGKAHMNRAIHDDIVAVEILPRSEWGDTELGTKTSKSIKTIKTSKITANDLADETPYGRVVYIVKRGLRPYVATIDAEDAAAFASGSDESGIARNVLVVPYEVRVPKIRIRTRHAGSLGESRLVVVIDAWAADSAYPSGHVVRELGGIGRVEAEVAAVLVENQIACPPFTAALYDTLPLNTPQHPWRVPQAELAVRRDLRGERVYSIDPPGCRDIDDALSVAQDASDSTRTVVGVHIADPTYFAVEGSLLDKEARMRSTTVYLPHRRFPMVPPALSEDLCSLHEGQERLAFSVVYTFDRECNVVSEWFGKTVVRSIHAMSYQQAHDVLHGIRSPATAAFADRAQLRTELETLLRISQKLKRDRAARGAVELFSEEVGFDFARPVSSGSSNGSDSDYENPLGFSLHEELEVNSLVEEFMILANESVARRIYRAYPETALLRRHVPPVQSQFERLLRCAASVGVELDTSSNKALAQSLGAVASPGTRNILMMLATRAMTEAEYFCTGAHEASEFYHYGLGSDFYTHFTSPIRRYSDMVVHRLLHAALQGRATAPVATKELEAMAEHMNMRNHGAKHAQKDAMLLFQVFYFRDKDVSADATVYTVRDNVLLVHIPQYAIMGKVYLTDSDGNSVVPDPFDVQKVVPRERVAVDTDREAVTITAENGKKCVVRNFDVVRVHIGVSISRSHKPSIVLTLVSFPSIVPPPNVNKKKKKNIKQQQQQQISSKTTKKEIVDSVLSLENDNDDDDDNIDNVDNNDNNDDDNNVYSFLQNMKMFMEKYFSVTEIDNVKVIDDTNRSSNKEQVIRRWCPTDDQVKKLEEERAQELRGPWADYLYQQQQQQQNSGWNVETKYKGAIEQAENQVKEAERARIKQRKQFKK